MMRRNHKSLQAARTELASSGFVTCHTLPDQPERWGKTKDTRRFVIAREARERSQVWHLIPASTVDWMDA